ncbi:D-threo-3-hydroxyaspartate dehydratase [compost metagenome]
MKQANIIVSIDSVQAAKGLSELSISIGQKVKLYIDVNTGLNRCGREPGGETAALVKEIALLPGVQIIGLMTHGGFAYGKNSPEDLLAAAQTEADGLIETKRLLEQAGIAIPEISVGSTPTSKFIENIKGVTEIRPGAYVYGDGSQLSIGIITPDECAMHIMATVVSVPRKGAAIIDAGSKTFSSDTNSFRIGYGTLRDHPEVYVERLSEEHGILHLPEGISYEIGDKLTFLPNHCCTVSNLHNELQGIRGDSMERTLNVDARGKIR